MMIATVARPSTIVRSPEQHGGPFVERTELAAFQRLGHLPHPLDADHHHQDAQQAEPRTEGDVRPRGPRIGEIGQELGDAEADGHGREARPQPRQVRALVREVGAPEGVDAAFGLRFVGPLIDIHARILPHRVERRSVVQLRVPTAVADHHASGKDPGRPGRQQAHEITLDGGAASAEFVQGRMTVDVHEVMTLVQPSIAQ